MDGMGKKVRKTKSSDEVSTKAAGPAEKDATAKRTLDEAAMTPFLHEITLASSGGAFLDGYVLSLIGVALTQITSHMNLTTHWTALIGASVLLGVLVGSIVGGYLTDLIGHKKMFVADIIAIALFSALSMTDTTPLLLVIYRFFIGVFVGADYPIATSLITEFTPQAPPRDIHGHGLGGVVFGRYRGCSRRLRFVRRRWRMEAHARLRHRTLRLPADRQVQSPRIAPVAEEQGTPRGGARVAFRVYGADIILEDEEEEPKHKAGFAEVFSKGYAARIVFLGILTLCQVVPMYTIYTFGPQIMTAFGLGVGKSAILGESVLSLFFLVGSLPAMFWLNSMGRRPLLIRSLFLMAVGLLALGLLPTAPFSR